MKKINLRGKHKNKFALVDDGDFEYLNQFKWYYCLGKKGHAYINTYLPTEQHSRPTMPQILLGKAPHNLEIDHINGDGLDNRRNNLRFVTHKHNMLNQLIRKDN